MLYIIDIVDVKEIFSRPIKTLSHREFIVWRESVKSVLQGFFRIKIEGKDNLGFIRPEKGLIVIANHQAGLDGFLMGMILPKHVHVIMNVKAFPHPLILEIAHYFGVIPYIPRRSSKWTNNKISELLEKGEFIGIFPEGAIHPLKKSFYGRKGFARYAVLNQVPVLPLGITGTLTVTPKKDYFRGISPPPFRKITISVGRPVEPTINSGSDKEIVLFKDYMMYYVRHLSDWYGVPKNVKKELERYYEKRKKEFGEIERKILG